MWLWWIVSVLILAGSIVFALYIFYSSYTASPVKKDFSLKRNFSGTGKIFAVTKKQLISSLKLKLQSVEHNSMLYYSELKKLQQRIQALEKDKIPDYQNSGYQKAKEQDENWEELYYQLHEEKEKMESALDLTNQKLEEAESLLSELKKRQTSWKEKRNEMENELTKAQGLEIKFTELQRDLASAADREQGLLQQLEEQKEVHKDFELLQQQHAYIQSEADELKSRIKEINNRDILLQQKINRLTELESTMEISEYEKLDIKKSLEEIITENEGLATKLHELQEKLNAEKYA